MRKSNGLFDIVDGGLNSFSGAFPLSLPPVTIFMIFEREVLDEQKVPFTLRLTNEHGKLVAKEFNMEADFGNRILLSFIGVELKNTVFLEPGEYRIDLLIAGLHVPAWLLTLKRGTS